MKKRIISIVLLVVLFVTAFASFSFAAEKETGLYKDSGKWKYYEEGEFKDVTGLVQKSSGTWHYVEKGVYKKASGLVQCVQPGPSKGKWYFVYKGDLDKEATGLAKCIQPGSSKGKWYYIKNGRLNKAFTGITESIQPDSSYGSLYYVKKGKLNRTTGVVKPKGQNETYLLKKGKVRDGYTGGYSEGSWNYFFEDGICVEKVSKKGSNSSVGPKRVLNRNSMKYHKPSCKYAGEIAKQNKWVVHAHNNTLKKCGYKACKVCKP